MQLTSCVLGIDLGTSAIKLVAVSPDGHVLASAREPYETISTTASEAEQRCQDWLEALSLASEKIRSQLTPEAQVASLALTGQIPTLVVIQGRKPAGPAITWQDSRADRWVSQRVDPALRLSIYRKTGVLIDGRYLAPMFRYHYGLEPKTKILSAKDFLFQSLTGVTATDPSTASGYGLYNLHSKTWDPKLSKFWGITRERLPAIESSSFRAPLSARGRQLIGCALGTPVVLGCADSVAGVYALGGARRRPPAATVLAGTSTVIMRCDSEPRWDRQGRYLLTPLATDGGYGLEADLLAGGSARGWAERVFHLGDNPKAQDSFWQSAYRVAPGADGLLFAPFLAGGEEGVLWNPRLRGTLAGLTLAHDRARIARALLEGMFFEIRRCLEVFEEQGPVSFVRVAGWITDVPRELEMLTDILGRPAHAFRLDSASAIGATLLSGLIDSKKYFAQTRPRVFTPGKRSKRYNAIYARYAAKFPAAAT